MVRNIVKFNHALHRKRRCPKERWLGESCLLRQRLSEKVVLSVNITAHSAAERAWGYPLNSQSEDMGGSLSAFHVPVMAAEVVNGLQVNPGGVYVDGTLGEGGHSLAILESVSGLDNLGQATEAASLGLAPGLVIGIDLDRRSVADAARRLSRFGPRFAALQGNYADMVSLAASRGIREVDGILLDLGFSSRQVDRPGYGLSFQTDEPLDMRYDSSQEFNAAELVNSTGERELADVFRRYGEEPRARQIAQAVVRERARGPIATTGQLAELVARVSRRRPGHRLHPATRVFQALRVAVNRELENLSFGLEAAVKLLRPGGVLAVISYHSIEDRIVKNFYSHQSAVCVCPPRLPVCVCGQSPALTILNRRVIRPSGEEVALNPRSRSARMRLARRTQSGSYII